MSKVIISDMTFKESQYNGLTGSWRAQTLYDFAKAIRMQEMPAPDFPQET
ncbi:MAG: hypothetical protein ACRCZB_07585 [Bacteroidales bacterium]